MFGRHVSDPDWSAPLDAMAAAEGGSLIDGVPERWLKSPTWRCPAAHVSSRLAQGRRARCVFCGSDVVPTFPGDRSGPLPVRNEWLDATRVGTADEVPAQSRHAASNEEPSAPLRTPDGITAPQLVFQPAGDHPDDGNHVASFSRKTGLRKPR